MSYYRRIRELREDHDMTQRQIAEILQISELTVKTQKRNAIVYLRKRLGRVYMLYVLFKVGFM